MSNAIVGLALFIAVLGGLSLFYSKLGRLSFWKLAAKLPDQAYVHVSNDPAWVIDDGSDSSPGAGFVGPFRLAIPSIGRTLRLYAREDQLVESQRRFIEDYRELLPKHGFPYLSLLALLYPVAAILSLADTPAPSAHILGYGFANLGYLLGAAAIIPGHFRFLSLDDRVSTLAAAVIFWVVGIVLTNVVG